MKKIRYGKKDVLPPGPIKTAWKATTRKKSISRKHKPDAFEKWLLEMRLWWGREVRRPGVYTDFGRNMYRGGYHVCKHAVKEYRKFKRRKR